MLVLSVHLVSSFSSVSTLWLAVSSSYVARKKHFFALLITLGTGPFTSQVEFGCSQSTNMWSDFVGSSNTNNFAEVADATLTTGLRTDCASCQSAAREGNSEQPHHCVGKYQQCTSDLHLASYILLNHKC